MTAVVPFPNTPPQSAEDREAARLKEVADHAQNVVDRVWARCVPYIAEALAHCGGTNTLEDVEALWRQGRVTLWPGENCAAVTEISTYPRKKVWRVWLAGGDLEEMQRMRPGMEAVARGCGCETIEYLGRLTKGGRRLSRAWEEASGYQPKWVQLSKDLHI